MAKQANPAAAAPERTERPEETETRAETGAAALNAVRRKKKRRKRVKRLVTWGIVLLVLLGGGWLWVQRMQAEYRVVYDPYTATVGTISNSLSYSGALQLIDSKTYTAPEAARVREVYVAAGDRVSEGDRLVRLSNGETLKADFAGTVNKVEAAAGDDVSAGAALVQLVDFDHMKVTVRVSENDIADVTVGQACRVTVASQGETFRSEIAEIDFSASTGNNLAYYNAVVYVDVSGAQGVHTGMQATVTVPQEEAADVVVLKLDALSTDRDNTAYVYKLQADGTMAASPVTVGVSNGNYVEIREGVAEGETVYAVSKTAETQSAWNTLLTNSFGSQQINAPSGGGQQRQRNNPGGGGQNNGR